MICVDVACTDQILPQLLAHIASLDADHHVVVRAGSQGIDLFLTHDSSPAASRHEEQSVIEGPASEPAHVVHFCSGATQANQFATPVSATKLPVTRYTVATVSMLFDVFVPKTIFIDSRPPPQRTAITLNRSTLLLI
jgi:hypothetical protein